MSEKSKIISLTVVPPGASANKKLTPGEKKFAIFVAKQLVTKIVDRKK